MKPLDKHYLSLQFKIRILSKNGSEFQSFFEDIMEKAFSDFQKVKPNGNKGDGGNDGYRKKLGIYYQVYAPNTPKVNEANAARKLRDDFRKLQKEWAQTSSIKEYCFVFNDKYEGSVQMIEQAMTELKKDNLKVDFNLFLAKELENAFFQLKESDMLDLGFNVDQRQAISIAHTYLEIAKTELDRENASSAQKILENIKAVVLDLGDESLSFECEILECRCLQKNEEIAEAKKKYKSIAIRYPNDPRPILHLAEIHLNNEDFDENNKLLDKAKGIDADFWLLKLEQVLRKLRLGEIIDTKGIDETVFPNDLKVKSNFYRLFSLAFENSGDQISADSFIEKSIKLNPDRFSNYVDKLTLAEGRLLSAQDSPLKFDMAQNLLDNIQEVQTKFLEYGDIGARNKALLNSKKLSAYYLQEDIPMFESVAKQTFDLLTSCYFDVQIEQIFIQLLQFISLPENDLNQLLEYLKSSSKKVSDNFSKMLVVQFSIAESLFDKGKKFFEDTHNQIYFDFICNLESRDYEKVLYFLGQDIRFSIVLANTLKALPDVRRKIIENLPDNKDIQKEKLLLLLSFDEEDFDEAFNTLKQIDLSNLNYLECSPLLQVAQKKQAWDFESLLLEKLLSREKNERVALNLKLQLFAAYINLKKFQDAITVGELLLEESFNKNLLDLKNKEVLLTNTIYACLERGKIDNDYFKEAKRLCEKYPLSNPSFEFKVGVEFEVYMNVGHTINALKSVVDGVKIKKVFTPHEYARLHFLFIKIGEQNSINTDSLPRVEDNTFVKLSSKDQWYFVGNDNELDALPIPKTNDKYQAFIAKSLGETIVFENKYGSESRKEIVERIFSTEKYILWMTVQNFNKLAIDGDLDGIQAIAIPQKGDSIDTKNLESFFKDLNAKTNPLFEMYCQNNVPLAMLAINEGGLTSAIGKIQNENKGFINFSDGTIEEFERQKAVAKKVVDEKASFYIDGTSALVLSEMGLFEKIHTHLPNLKIPQSVINFLANIADKFRYTTGHMGYAQDKIFISPALEKDKGDFVRARFVASIKLLEVNPKNVTSISAANKEDCFSERRVPPELSDACILAQKENLPVLTEDPLYLRMNEAETKKKIPEYFSSLALLRLLYEQKQVDFDEYLDYFGYLSSYRFRFLSLTLDDIEKTVFGDGKVKVVRPEYIRKLNFPLTLSEEYGVPFQTAFKIVGVFLLKILADDSVTLEASEKIYIEIIQAFPTKMSKKDLGHMLLQACIQTIESPKSKWVYKIEDKLKYQKIDRLLRVVEIYNIDLKFLSPT